MRRPSIRYALALTLAALAATLAFALGWHAAPRPATIFQYDVCVPAR